jgi:hypothetical protein
MKTVKILLSSKRATAFMQGFDMFEKSKVLVQPVLMAKVVDDFGDSHIEAIKKQCDEGNSCGLVAIFDLDNIYYRDPDVVSISDGHKWCLLDEILSSEMPFQKEVSA